MIFTEEQMRKYCRIIKDSVERNDYSSMELGAFVSSLVKAVLDSGNFVGYTEDWKLEMFGEACLKVFEGMKDVDLSQCDRAYNYLYTIACNRVKKVVTRLKKELSSECPIFDESSEVLQPFYLRNKRRMVSGLLEKKKSEIVSAASQRKQMLLKNAVGKALHAVASGMNVGKISELIQLSRQGREAALC